MYILNSETQDRPSSKETFKMRLRDLDFTRVIQKIDKGITDWFAMADLEEAYELWSWHPGMG